jgi:hypothetical protein
MMTDATPELDVKNYERIPFDVTAVRVTSKNIEQVAAWCGGEVLTSSKKDRDLERGRIDEKYVKVRVYRPMGDRQTMAFVGDWVLYAGKGYKVYTNLAFQKTFVIKPEREIDRISSRDAVTGEFVTPEYAETHPETTVTEAMKETGPGEG